MKKELQTIYKIQKEISILNSVIMLLDWDQKTYMPKDANKNRAEQMALVGKLIHEKFLSEKLYKSAKKLHALKTFNSLKKRDQIVVKKLYKKVLDARKLPLEFVEDLSKTASMAVMAWQEAKEKDDFKIFAPWLEKLVKLKRKQCEYVKLPGHYYNSLLDDFEEGMTVEKLKPIFQKLKEELIVLLKEVKRTRRYKKQKSILRNHKFSKPKQRKLCRDVINRMNLPSGKTRLDISSHPFTLSLSLEDVRITTRYNEKNPFASFYATIHEAGHALYGLGLPHNFEHTLIASPASVGLNESQSRFWENMISKNVWFWNFYFYMFKKMFKKELKHVVLKDFYKEINSVRPSLNRVEADEITYCLHVILRFELELALIEGKLKVKDLPKNWNKKMKSFLGIKPKNDSEGVLQDMHWGLGYFGYFPTYAIGTIYAAQLFNRLAKEKPSIKKQIEQGNFNLIVNWLRKHVHEHGYKLTAEEIIKKTCKKGLDPEEYINYLRNKYLGLYK